MDPKEREAVVAAIEGGPSNDGPVLCCTCPKKAVTYLDGVVPLCPRCYLEHLQKVGKASINQ